MLLRQVRHYHKPPNYEAVNVEQVDRWAGRNVGERAERVALIRRMPASGWMKRNLRYFHNRLGKAGKRGLDLYRPDNPTDIFDAIRYALDHPGAAAALAGEDPPAPPGAPPAPALPAAAVPKKVSRRAAPLCTLLLATAALIAAVVVATVVPLGPPQGSPAWPTLRITLPTLRFAPPAVPVVPGNDASEAFLVLGASDESLVESWPLELRKLAGLATGKLHDALALLSTESVDALIVQAQVGRQLPA